jgi:hypothetical protein
MSFKISPIEYGQWFDTTTQSIASSAVAQIVTFNGTSDETAGITKGTGTGSVANSRFTFATTGAYLVVFSAICNSASGNHNINIWFRTATAGNTPADVTNSNTIAYMSGSASEVMAVTFFLRTVTQGETLEIWMSGDSSNSQIQTTVAGVSPTRPATPSIILSINKISK